MKVPTIHRTIPRFLFRNPRYHDPVPDEENLKEFFDEVATACLSVIPIGTGGITISEADMRHLERMRSKRGGE